MVELLKTTSNCALWFELLMLPGVLHEYYLVHCSDFKITPNKSILKSSKSIILHKERLFAS